MHINFLISSLWTAPSTANRIIRRLSECRQTWALVEGSHSLPFNANDQNQLAEFISPFQFFLLQNQATANWLTRDSSGPNIHFQAQQDGNNDQLFTVPRYGEVISPMDGFVLQNAGANPATFVDTAPQAIGFATTTFRYAADGTIAPGQRVGNSMPSHSTEQQPFKRRSARRRCRIISGLWWGSRVVFWQKMKVLL